MAVLPYAVRDAHFQLPRRLQRGRGLLFGAQAIKAARRLVNRYRFCNPPCKEVQITPTRYGFHHQPQHVIQMLRGYGVVEHANLVVAAGV